MHLLLNVGSKATELNENHNHWKSFQILFCLCVGSQLWFRMHQSTYENRAINSTCILTWKWSPFVICQEREAEAKQCGVKKNSLVIMCRLLHDPPLPPLGFSQTCYVSAGLMQACSELKVESAFFFSLSALQHFFLFSISGSDSRQADERVFWEIWRWELIWLTQQGGHDRKKNWIETRVRGWMGVRGVVWKLITS